MRAREVFNAGNAGERAVIDIGSNTANCAVYERTVPGALDRLGESSEPLKLMRRLSPDGTLSPAVVEWVTQNYGG